MAVANILAYYDTETVKVVKKVYITGPWKSSEVGLLNI